MTEPEKTPAHVVVARLQAGQVAEKLMGWRRGEEMGDPLSPWCRPLETGGWCGVRSQWAPHASIHDDFEVLEMARQKWEATGAPEWERFVSLLPPAARYRVGDYMRAADGAFPADPDTEVRVGR